MGMFDTVHVRCPKCDHPTELQSKAGPCSLTDFTLNTAPPEVLQDIESRTAPGLWCSNCGYSMRIITVTMARVV